MKKDILATIEDVLRSVLNLPASEVITVDSNLRDNLGLDSMSTLSFLIELEEKIKNFTVDPDTLDANDLKTVGSLADYVIRETQGTIA